MKHIDESLQVNRKSRRRLGRVLLGLVLPLALVILSGCGMLFGAQEPGPVEPDQAERVLVPTFTPTPEGGEQVAQAPEVPAAPAAPQEPLNTPTPLPVEETEQEDIAQDVTEPEPVEEAPEPTPEPPTPTPAPRLFVNIEAANVRNGPGTTYGLAGAASMNQEFEVIARSPDGGWWQICCVNGQQVWIFGDLTRTENVDGVPIAQNIPAPPPPPVAQAPEPAAPQPEPQPQPEPEQPAEPEPEAPPPPSQAANAGPCSECKFKLTGGPVKHHNGGYELKIFAYFIHGGVDGGQPQGDYRVGIEKDGQLIVPFADMKSISLTTHQSALGPYNYEAKVGSSDVPGGTVAGRYHFWVIDGNRIRDSEVWTMDVADGEGEIWFQFDQN